MISHGVEISIAGGGVDKNDERGRGQRGLYRDFTDIEHFTGGEP